jgi:tRNA nucleotidyltransferase (CCA-adding enzyme)
MADYIYLLETRLSPAQQAAIGTIRNIAREDESTIFLTGGAVRDLTGGGPIRDLDLTLQGDVLKLKKTLEQAGVEIVGEHAESHQLFLLFPGGVRVELSSAVAVTYPKPAKPVYALSNLTDDLRRRDFTANAMAISLNEGSYGLLMDPLNGVADIENRELRLVSNYGFIEDPSRLIRVARLSSRLGWQMEEKTRQRYETAKEENYIEPMGSWNRGYELEEIFHEDDPPRILRALEAAGWMSALYPALSASKANTAALADVAERQGQLQMVNVLSTSAALTFPLITAKMTPAEVAGLKQMFVRPGFVREIDTLEARTKDFGTQVAGKEAALPSAAWRILYAAEPNLVLSLLYSSKTGSVQARLKTFLTESPTARQRIPYTLMQEMRIVPDLPGYAELVNKLFFELMDGKLSTPEEMKAFLEPYSPPAPPPPVNLRRARAKKEARPSRAKSKKAVAAAATVAAEEEATGVAEGLMEPGTLTGPDRGTEPTVDTPLVGKVAPEAKAAAKPAKKETAPVVVPAPKKAATPAKAAPVAPVPVKAAPAKPAPAAKQPVVVVVAPVKAASHRTAPSSRKKAVPANVVTAAKHAPAKAPVKAAPPAKASTKKVAGTKAVAAKPVKAVPTAKKAVPAKKATPPAKKAVPQKSAVAKKAVPAKKAPAKKAVAKKGSTRR